MKLQGTPIVCSGCGVNGGTLIKIGRDTYRHQDRKLCRKLRKEVNNGVDRARQAKDG